MISIHIFYPSKEIIYGSPHLSFNNLKNSTSITNKFTYKTFEKYLVGILHPNLDEFLIKRKITELVELEIFKLLFTNFEKFCIEIENNFFSLIKINPILKSENYIQKEKLYIDINEEISCIIDEENKIDYYFGKGEICLKPYFNKPKIINLSYNLSNKTIFDFSNKNKELILLNSIIFQKYTFCKSRIPLNFFKINQFKYSIQLDINFKSLIINFPFNNYKLINIPFGILKYSENGIQWISSNLLKGKYYFNISFNDIRFNNIFDSNNVININFSLEQTSLSGLQLNKVFDNIDEVLIKHTAFTKSFEIRKSISFEKVFNEII